MSTSLLTLPARGAFRPRYIQAQELPLYGLPGVDQQPNILALVDAASTLIDAECGRTDAMGMGSLVWTTYAERILLQAPGRNIFRTSFKPMVALDPTTVQILAASANAPLPVPNGQPLEFRNWMWTGVQANTIVRPNGQLSSILACSGRYTYGRRSAFAVYPDLNYGINPLMIATFFGGPPNFVPIDVGSIDWDLETQSGECWVPAGIYLSQYNEVTIYYNAGYNPLNMPPKIKDACAAICRNFLARAGGTTALKGISGQGMVNFQLGPKDIDDTVSVWLAPFRNVIAY